MKVERIPHCNFCCARLHSMFGPSVAFDLTLPRFENTRVVEGGRGGHRSGDGISWEPHCLVGIRRCSVDRVGLAGAAELSRTGSGARRQQHQQTRGCPALGGQSGEEEMAVDAG